MKPIKQKAYAIVDKRGRVIFYLKAAEIYDTERYAKQMLENSSEIADFKTATIKKIWL